MPQSAQNAYERHSKHQANIKILLFVCSVFRVKELRKAKEHESSSPSPVAL